MKEKTKVSEALPWEDLSVAVGAGGVCNSEEAGQGLRRGICKGWGPRIFMCHRSMGSRLRTLKRTAKPPQTQETLQKAIEKTCKQPHWAHCNTVSLRDFRAHPLRESLPWPFKAQGQWATRR